MYYRFLHYYYYSYCATPLYADDNAHDLIKLLVSGYIQQ